MKHVLGISFVCVFGALGTVSAEGKGADLVPLSLEDGDRVVFLGNAFFERARYYGRIETSLALCWPDSDVTFRNIGWSGDTVGGVARTSGRRGARFGTEAQGYRRLVDHVESLDPTHVFIAYGFNESFDGSGGLESFAAKLDRLLTSIEGTDREIILLSPLPMEHNFGASPSEVDERNTIIKIYADAIQEKARARNHRYVDLFDALLNDTSPYSDDGIHPTDEGYARIADILEQALELHPVTVDVQTRESIRAEIVKKNALYFHRWRPRNDAFVYGERKDEQPIAQSEPETIEPFIKQQEAIIRDLLSTIEK
jgi:lysophospholipase L1-like esterase